MLEGNESSIITSKNVMDWMIKEEPHLVKKIHDHFLRNNLEMSFDSVENTRRLTEVSAYFIKHAEEIYAGLSTSEKLLIYIMKNGFGWIVYEEIESTLKIISKIFRFESDGLIKAVDSLSSKFLLFKYDRLKKYSFLFSPPVFLRNIDNNIVIKDVFGENYKITLEPDDLLNSHYIPLIAGLISYIITYSPRSSETNEIHKIDFDKLLAFFSDFAEKHVLELIIKKLTRFGFFQKFNNRIIINKHLFDSIASLSINEQLYIIFLYEFMDRFDFKKSAFMTLKLLASRSFMQKNSISLRELFFYYLNNQIYISLKNDSKNLKLLLQQEELKFIFFVKNLETENIAMLKRVHPDVISIATDYIIMNEPHASLLNNVDFSNRFVEEKFIVESNFDIIVEPFVKPDILFKLALFTEPQTIQTISIFKISKESIYRSLAYGIKKEEIIDFLKSHSKHSIPENVLDGIRNFIDNLSAESMEDYRIIQISAHSSALIKENYKNQIIEIEPHTFIVFNKTILKSIEDYCKREHISTKYINDFLGENYNSSLLPKSLSHNIKHLHAMKAFFDFYGSEPIGANLKIDNTIN